MDLQKFLQEKGSGLVQQLTTQVGLAPQTAQSFLSKTATKVVDLVKSGTIDPKSLIGKTDWNPLINKLGIGQIARQVGIDEGKATAGAKAVLPWLVETLQGQAGGLGAMMGNPSQAGDFYEKSGETFRKE
jgi:uncharacterized protein YidB (DUF937 family)